MCCIVLVGISDNPLTCLWLQGSETVQALLTHPSLPSTASQLNARRVNQATSKRSLLVESSLLPSIVLSISSACDH